MTDFLEALQNHLSDAWNPQFHPAQGAEGFPHLVQQLGPMQLTIVQLSAAQWAVGSTPEQADLDRLQMYVALPFPVEADHLTDTMQLLNHLNSQLPLLGFIIGATGDTIAFRYLHLFDPDNPGYALIEEAMTQIKFAVANYTPVIHTVNSGAATYAQIIQNNEAL